MSEREILSKAYLQNLEVCSTLGLSYIPFADDPEDVDLDTLQVMCMDVCKFLTSRPSAFYSEKELGYPQGAWYMITITTSKDREDILRLHEKFIRFTTGDVVHAVLEKSAIWHIHYAVRFKCVQLNLKRDLKGTLSTIVDVGRKVTSKKLFNGMCKYLLKRDYPDKESTQEEILIDGISYSDGSGYTLKEK